MSLSSQFTTTVSGGTYYNKILDSIVFIETLQTWQLETSIQFHFDFWMKIFLFKKLLEKYCSNGLKYRIREWKFQNFLGGIAPNLRLETDDYFQNAAYYYKF